MHRLKQWFGMKDWQGPEQKEDSLKPETQEPQVQNNSDNTVSKEFNNQDTQPTKPPTLADVVAALKENQTKESIFLKYNENFENWLKQYIPVKEKECAQCKLVTTVFLGTLMVPLLYSLYNLKYVKALEKSMRIRVRLVVLSFGMLSYSILYERLFQVGFFTEELEKKTTKDFVLGALAADKEKLMRVKEYVKKNVKDSGTESEKE